MFTHSGNRSRTAIGIIHRSAEWNLGRCRPKFHKSANVLAALPKSAHPGAIKAMQEIYNAEDIDHARVAVKAFKNDYGTKFPKAVEKITKGPGSRRLALIGHLRAAQPSWGGT